MKTKQIIKRGGVEVTIHPETNSKKTGEQFTRYVVTYYEAGIRKKTNRATKKAAEDKAKEIAGRISRQETHALKYTDGERATLKAATSILKPHGITIIEAVNQWANARKVLPEGCTLTEAVADFAARSGRVGSPLIVTDLVSRYVAMQEKRGLASETVRKRESRANMFAIAFGSMPVHTITKSMLISYLDTAGLKPWTKLSHYKMLRSLFGFAVDHNHATEELLKDLTVAKRHLPKIKRGAVRGLVYTPEEMREILECVRLKLLPEVVLIAFCGVRMQEIINRDKPPLDWSQVKLDRGHVDLDDEQAKAEHRRLAPIPANAAEWLRQHLNREGRVAGLSDPNKLSVAIRKDVNDAREKAGLPRDFKWRKNGLRHSFISYRCALLDNIPKVAAEAGNSVDQIHATYREVRTKEEAEEYFGISPQLAENIVSMKAA